MSEPAVVTRARIQLKSEAHDALLVAMRNPELTLERMRATLKWHELELVGPPAPPWAEDNGCGPKLRTRWNWLNRFVAWVIPDNPYGYRLGLACRDHDWQWELATLFWDARSWGLRQDAAHQELARYLAWLGQGAELWQIEIGKLDADAYLRENVGNLLAWQGAGWWMRTRFSWGYWLGVRFGREFS